MSRRGQLPGFVAAGHYRIGRFEVVKLVSPQTNSQRVARWEVRASATGRPLIVDGRPLRRHTARDAIQYAQEAEAVESKLEEAATMHSEIWSLRHDSRCVRDLCHPDCEIRRFAEESDLPYRGRQ